MKLKDLREGMIVQARLPRHMHDFRPIIRGEIVAVGVPYDTEDVYRANLAGNVGIHTARTAFKSDGVKVKISTGEVYSFAARCVMFETTLDGDRYIAQRSPYGAGIYDLDTGQVPYHNIARRNLQPVLVSLNEKVVR